MGRVLIVDDEPHMRKILTSSLGPDKHVVSLAAGVKEAREVISGNQFEVIVTDQNMPDGTGLDVLHAAHQADPHLSVIVLSALASPDLAMQSMKSGAYDFLAKPVTPEVLRAEVQQACDRTRLMRENSLLRGELRRLQGPAEILGDAPAIRDLREKVAQLAQTSAPVLITGELGTGKEMVARAIHRQSKRSAKPFVYIHCAASNASSLENELFGDERTGVAVNGHARIGLFEAAHEGTLFLDGLAEMSPGAQARLQHFLNDGLITRIGSAKARPVDVRVLAATHRDLIPVVKEGLFREDLYNQFAATHIGVPPLRARAEDISALCELFLAQTTRELRLPRRYLSVQALQRLQSYEFPGNVRELRNLIERAVILSPGEEIGVEHLPLRTSAGADGQAHGNGASPMNLAWIADLPPTYDLRNLLSTLEKTLIERTLQATRGAQAEAARRLGLSRSDLSYKLLKYELRKETTAVS